MYKPGTFVVITTQRTGSTLLIRSLDASPAILCAGEIFYRGDGIHHPEFQYRMACLGSESLGRAVDVIIGRYRVERHLTRFYSEALKTHSAAGFKVMISQLRRRPSIMTFLERERVRRIHLFRRDVFATALSYYKARHSGVYHRDRSVGGREPRLIEADVSEFATIIATCRAEQEQLLLMNRESEGHLVAYEDLEAHWDEVIAGIGAVIGLSSLSLPQALSKLGDRFSGTVVSNEEALRRVFCEGAAY